MDCRQERSEAIGNGSQGQNSGNCISKCKRLHWLRIKDAIFGIANDFACYRVPGLLEANVDCPAPGSSQTASAHDQHRTVP